MSNSSDLKLYYTPGACSLAAHILLCYIKEKKGINFCIEKVNLKTHTTENGEDYFAINKRGAVPALQSTKFGKDPLTQNVAILNFIADTSKINHLMLRPGSTERARVDEALGFCSDLHYAVVKVLYPAESAQDRATNLAKAHRSLQEIEKWLSPGNSWWLGSSFTPADLYLAVVLSWCVMLKIDLTPYRKANNLRKKVFALDAAQEALKAEGLPLTNYS